MDGKKLLITALIILLFFVECAVSYAAAEDDNYSTSFFKGTFNTIEEAIKNSFNREDIKRIIPDFNITKMLKDLTKGQFPIKPGELIKNVIKIFFDEFIKIIVIGIKVMGILLLIGMINNIKSSFGSSKVSEIAFYCGYVVIVLMLYNVIQSGLNMTMDIVKNASSFIFAISPVLIGLMATSGQVASSVIAKPFYITSMIFMFSLLQKVILPMILFQAVISFVINLTDKMSIKSIASLNKNIALWLLGGFMTLFVGILTLQGSLGYSIDNVTAKTAKFTLNTFIPFVGKYIADASDTVIACSMLLKNSAGVFATIILIGICLIPLIKATSISLLFKLLSVVSEIVAEKRFTSLLSDVSHIFLILAGIIATIVIIFYISICFVMGSIKPI